MSEGKNLLEFLTTLTNFCIKENNLIQIKQGKEFRGKTVDESRIKSSLPVENMKTNE